MKKYILILYLLITSISLCANAGIPMIMMEYPILILALLPVIIIESISISNILNIEHSKTIKPIIVANLVSTLLGYPLTWGLRFLFLLLLESKLHSKLVFILLISFGPAWIGSSKDKFLPVYIMLAMIPAFLFSVFIEYFILKRFFKNINKDKILKSTWIINIYSYGFIIFGLLIWFIYKKI